MDSDKKQNGKLKKGTVELTPLRLYY